MRPIQRWAGLAFALLVCTTATGTHAQSRLVDSDDDGVPDPIDNCIKTPNPLQLDADADGLGNACDADLDQDGKVTKLDYTRLKRALVRQDPVADLDEDGKVGERDVEIFKTLLDREPGPSGLPLHTDFVQRPPVPRAVQLYRFEQALPNGRNALLEMDFNGAFDLRRDDLKAPPDRLIVQAEGGLVLVNDLGLQGDEKAGDGVFTGLLVFDVERHFADAKALTARALKKQVSSALQFNGREAVDRVKFEPGVLIDPPFKERFFKFDLGRFGGFAGLGYGVPTLPDSVPATTRQQRTLMVTNLGVVQDPVRTYSPCQPSGAIAPFGNPDGVWSFKTLMSNMAHTAATGVSPQVFVNDWLRQWLVSSPGARHSDGGDVSFPITARPQLLNVMHSLQPGWDPNVPATLDLDRLPFRLLAIVNRLDLAEASFYGAGSGGELRFVFGLVERQGAACVPSREMTVILEYQVPPRLCPSLRTLAQRWIALDTKVPGAPAYNAELQSLTDEVTPAGAMPGKPNGSAIAQVRTNEVRMGFPWEMREFTLQPSPVASLLKPATVKNTPDASFNRTPLLANWIEFHAGQPVPRQFGGNDFVGSANRYGPGAFPANPPWNGNPLSNPTKRHAFSLNTCGGCHLSETGTRFTMVRADGPLNAEAKLSRFLTGTTVADAEYGPPPAPGALHSFADLDRRGQKLDQLASKQCLFLPPLRFIERLDLFRLPIDPRFDPRERFPLLHESAFSPAAVH